MKQPFQAPRFRRQPGRFRRSRFQRHVNAAEVVISEEQGHCRSVIRQLLAVRVRQPGQAANLHPKSLVAAFNVARANAGLFRLAKQRGFNRADYLRWRVTTGAFLRFTVDLDQCGVVDATPVEDGRDRRPVRRESVRGQLEVALGSEEKIVGENRRVGRRPFANVIG